MTRQVSWWRAGTRTGNLPAVTILLGFALVAVVGPLLWPYQASDLVARPLLPPGAANPLGTDNLGRDVLAQMIAGARATLVVALLAVGVSSIAGFAVGAAAGYWGGLPDEILSRVSEFVQVSPRLLIAIVVVLIFGPSIFTLAVVIGGLAWPSLARLTRGEYLAQRELEYVQAARAAGARGFEIVVGEILPIVLPTIIAQVTLEVGRAILLAAGLGFLGLSDPSTVTWGQMLHDAQSFTYVAWWMYVFPGLAIFAMVWAFNSLGRTLTAAFDPRA